MDDSTNTHSPDNSAGHNATPTYSTWEFRDGELVPVRALSRSPSPPPPSEARREFDDRIRAAHRDRAAEAARTHRCVLASELHWRVEKLLREWEEKAWNRPYRLLGPWPLEMRMQCANYMDLLEDYYRAEVTTRELVEVQMEEYESAENQWQIQDEQAAEIAHLTKLQKEYEADEKAGNDFKVLSQVLTEVEMTIYSRIDKVHHRGAQEGESRLASDLPMNIMIMIARDGRLQKRLEFLAAAEREYLSSHDELPKRRLESSLVHNGHEKRQRGRFSLLRCPFAQRPHFRVYYRRLRSDGRTVASLVAKANIKDAESNVPQDVQEGKKTETGGSTKERADADEFQGMGGWI
jgi:hypothetical protein